MPFYLHCINHSIFTPQHIIPVKAIITQSRHREHCGTTSLLYLTVMAAFLLVFLHLTVLLPVNVTLAAVCVRVITRRRQHRDRGEWRSKNHSSAICKAFHRLTHEQTRVSSLSSFLNRRALFSSAHSVPHTLAVAALLDVSPPRGAGRGAGRGTEGST